jgi:hypothetical protein
LRHAQVSSARCQKQWRFRVAASVVFSALYVQILGVEAAGSLGPGRSGEVDAHVHAFGASHRFVSPVCDRWQLCFGAATESDTVHLLVMKHCVLL